MGRPRVTLDCGAIRQPDLCDLDALLRIRLALCQSGCELILEPCGRELTALIQFAGFADVLSAGLQSVESGRESEERK
jgi:hypothetical protein